MNPKLLAKRFPVERSPGAAEPLAMMSGMYSSRHGIDLKALWQSYPSPSAYASEDDERPDRASDEEVGETGLHEARHAVVAEVLGARVLSMRHRPADRPDALGLTTIEYPADVDDWTRAVVYAAGSNADRGQLEKAGIFLSDFEWAEAVLEADRICDRNAPAVRALYQAYLERDLDEGDVQDVIRYHFVR